MIVETRKQRLKKLSAQLKAERLPYENNWKDLAEYCRGHRAMFGKDAKKGERRSAKIIDNTPILAARTAQAGMMSGITSPARPWFRLTTPDLSLGKNHMVKEWLHKTTEDMRSVFIKSNLYNKLPTVYGDLIVFGTSCLYIEPDFNNVIHAETFQIGTYWFGLDEKGRVNTFMREFKMTVGNVILKFATDQNGEVDFSNVSQYVKDQYTQGNTQTWVDVVHFIFPNEKHDPKNPLSQFKKYASCYYEAEKSNEKTDKFLSEKGYDYFPILAPRWETTPEEVYGVACPGMDALGDIKQLQIQEERFIEGVEKLVRPPITGQASSIDSVISILPGEYTPSADERSGGLRPMFQVAPQIFELKNLQMMIRNRISRAFYEDLFLMLSNEDRRNITATEIDERKEEKLLALGPVLEQVNQDLLDPLIDITFNIMVEQERIAEPPEEIAGVDLKVEYISIMAQAQKLVGLGAIERLTGFVGQLASFVPNALKKLKSDEIVDVYAEYTGVPPTIVRSKEEMDEISKAEAQAQAQAQMQQQAAVGLGAMKELSQIETSQGSALDQLSGEALS